MIFSLLAAICLFHKKSHENIIRPLSIEEIEIVILALNRVSMRYIENDKVIEEVKKAFLDISNPPFIIEKGKKVIFGVGEKIFVQKSFFSSDTVHQEIYLQEFIKNFGQDVIGYKK